MGQPARVAQVTPKHDHKQPAKIVEGGGKDGNTTRLDNPQQREDQANSQYHRMISFPAVNTTGTCIKAALQNCGHGSTLSRAACKEGAWGK
ncbi:hypothetical protein TEQG_01247 [Trichophyton equinum CBS 127.97]|uniref:Uncharacterized protein n=1 Tax=Trichophyton equinum (strain ATCC MYA-4606 / CBS 127.97) TaxID=559882 RepID=F2PJY9_TRIEC|nr:hypothetical protein TEQG_01247 [Trichophyton equinum CBS 127.97]